MSKKYDAIIIGSGSVGTPTAYFLSKAGLKVLVVDELASSGQGQNKAAIGGIRATHSDPAKIQICLQSLDIFSSWKKKTGTDIGWKKGGWTRRTPIGWPGDRGAVRAWPNGSEGWAWPPSTGN